MSTIAPNLNTPLAASSSNPGSSASQSSSTRFMDSAPLAILQTVMEGLMDGILIVTTSGQIVEMNLQARQMCRQLPWNAGNDSTPPSLTPPEEIWRVCKALIDSQDLFPSYSITPESEVRAEDGRLYRIRVRWLRFEVEGQQCILVTLEDRQQSLENMAIADSQKYGLTERESEVWRMRLLGHSYQQIASELYIAENTVKKHIKSIFSKRRSVLDDLDNAV